MPHRTQPKELDIPVAGSHNNLPTRLQLDPGVVEWQTGFLNAITMDESKLLLNSSKPILSFKRIFSSSENWWLRVQKFLVSTGSIWIPLTTLKQLMEKVSMINAYTNELCNCILKHGC